MKCDYCQRELNEFYFLSIGDFINENPWQTPGSDDGFKKFKKYLNFCSYECGEKFRNLCAEEYRKEGKLAKYESIYDIIKIYKISRCSNYYDCKKWLDNIRDDVCESHTLSEEDEKRREEDKKRLEAERKKDEAERERKEQENKRQNLEKLGFGDLIGLSGSLASFSSLSDIVKSQIPYGELATYTPVHAFSEDWEPPVPNCKPAEVAIIKANIKFIESLEKYSV